MTDWKNLVSIVVDEVKAFVNPRFELLQEQFRKQIDSAQSRVGDPGPKGDPGKDADPELVRAIVSEEVAKNKPLWEPTPPADGKNGLNAYEVAVSLGFEGTVHDWMKSLDGKPGEPGTSVTVEDVRPLIEAGLDGVKDAINEAVKAAVEEIPKPRDGIDGDDGEPGSSVTAEQVLPELRSELQKAIAALPIPKDGKDSVVTAEDFRTLFEAESAKALLSFERRAQDVLQRAIDGIRAPSDGKDGLGFDDMEPIYDGERTVILRFVRGDTIKELTIKLPVPIDRGVYRAGQKYERGDCVSYGGSSWTAQRDTESKPESDDSWRLAVKRGRDGRDKV